MEYRIVNTSEEFDLLQDAWERLENTMPEITFFSTFGYARIKWEVYKNFDKFQLWMIVVEHNKAVVGIAPLMIVNEKNRFFKWKSLQLLAVGDYGDFLVDHNTEVKISNIYKEIFKAIEDNNDIWDEVNIHHLDSRGSLTLHLLASKYNDNTISIMENPYIDFEYIRSNKDEHLSKLPRSTRTLCNRLKKKTDYSLNIVKPTSLAEYMSIHRRERDYYHSVGRLSRRSQYDDPIYRKIIQELIGHKMVTSISLTDVSEKTIIYKLSCEYRGVFYDFNNGFDPSFTEFSPGKVLMFEIINKGMSTDAWKCYDFGAGRYEWKFEWATGFNLLYTLYIVNPRATKLKKWKKLQRIRGVMKT